MRAIESIKYRKTKRVCLITFNDDSCIELDMDLVLEYTLKKGMELHEETLEEIESKQAIISAKQDAYNYASYRLRSEWQVRQKLEGKNYPNQLIDRCIDFLKEFDLIDDSRFAAAYIKDSLLKKKDGPIKLKMKLKSFGVEDSVCNKTINSYYPFECEKEFAAIAAEKKLSSLQNKPKIKQKASLINHLQSKGYTNSIIKVIVDKYIDI